MDIDSFAIRYIHTTHVYTHAFYIEKINPAKLLYMDHL